MRAPVLITLCLSPVLAAAEGTLTATVVHADFSQAPEVRLLVRVLDEAFATDQESIVSQCPVARAAGEHLAPDSCFEVTIDEGSGAVQPMSQTLLARPERASDPIYLELVYRTQLQPLYDDVYSRPTARLRVETNGFYNWNDEMLQALPQNVMALGGINALVLGDADALLNAAYRERLRQLSDEASSALRQAQRNWIAMRRDAECKPYGEEQPYSVFGEFSYDCLVRLTLDRARQLAVVRGDQS